MFAWVEGRGLTGTHSRVTGCVPKLNGGSKVSEHVGAWPLLPTAVMRAGSEFCTATY